jgi:PAS domain S-box-containing protein
MNAFGIFKKQRIATLVWSGFSLLIVLGLATSLFLLLQLRRTLHQGEALEAATLNVRAAVRSLHAHYMDPGLIRALLSPQPAVKVEEYRARSFESSERTDELLRLALASTGSEALRRVLRELEKHDNEVTDPIEEEVLALARTDLAAAREMCLTRYLPAQDKNVELAVEAKTLAVQEIAVMADRAHEESKLPQFWSRLAIAAFLGLGMATAFFLTRAVAGLVRHASEAARETSDLMDHSMDVICSVNAEGRFTKINGACERIWGYRPDELLGRAYIELVHPDDAPETNQYATDHIEGRAGENFENRYIRKDGAVVNMLWASRWSAEQQTFFCVVHDITERKRAETELRKSEERFQLVARATHDPIWDWNIVANVISFSATSGTVFGLPAGKFESASELWTNSIHPDDRDQVMASIHAFFASREEAWSSEYRFRCADGSYAFVYGRGCVVRDAGGKPLRMVGSLTNITERKRAEEELTHSRRLLDEAQQLARIGSWEWDVTTNEVVWSDEAYRVFGFVPRAFVPTYNHYLASIHPDDQLPMRVSINAILRRKKSLSADNRIVRPDGAVRVLHNRSSPILDDSGKVLRLVGTVQDVTELRQKENELLLAKSSAEAANRTKSEFLANMSHEIRTPMNGILGMTELVLDTELSLQQREYLGMAKSSALSLLGLINDILDFSKIEAGKLALEAISFSLRDCLGAMLKPLGIRADQKGLELTADISAVVPDHLIGDPMRLRQILINLTDNAIKFTQRGDVTLSVTVESAIGDEHCLHFAIADTGVGIPEEKRALIFEAFAQADGTTTRTYGGTGLGLSIASQLVRHMGGRIWVESKVGEGTTFHFTVRMPVRHTPAPNVRHADLSELEGLRVLVVDDNAVNRRILREMLLHWRMQPSVVASGAAAIVEMLRAAHAGTPFPLVILDGMMPEMNGFNVVEQIREHAELSAATVMMLSSAMPAGAVARCGELGVASYLTKPVTQAELIDAILIALGGANAIEPVPATPSIPRAATSLRILLAEDNPINRAVAAGILEKRGHSLVHADNGREAVEAVARENFDLILMDVQMPEMDGFEATRRIREFEKATGRQTRIVAMTAHAMAGDRERCLAAGMDDYVSKPLQKTQLLALLEGISAGRKHTGAAIPQNGQRSRIDFSTPSERLVSSAL